MSKRLTLGAAILGATIAAGAFLAGPLLAQDTQSSSPPASGGNNTALICMNAGNQYAVGEFACIAACHERRRLARCDRTASSASWTYASEACPSAMINPPWPSDHTELAAVTVMSPIPLDVNMSAPIPEAKVLAFASFEKPPTSLR